MTKIKLWFLVLIPFLFACTEEEINLEQNNNLQVEELAGTKGDIAFRTTCDITGTFCGTPGGTSQLSYTANFLPSDITWSIQRGNISIIGGQGTSTVTLQFASNFTGGSVTALGTGSGGIVCSDVQSITVCDPPCTPPTSMDIDQINGACEGDIFTFTADPNGSTDSGSYSWSVGNGASITSGQGSQTIQVQSPSSGGFSISVSHVNDCEDTSLSAFTLAEFDAGCSGGGGLGGF